MAKRGRPPKPDDEKVKQRSVRLNERHYQIFKQCGRDKWLRDKLEEEANDVNLPTSPDAGA